MNTAFSSWKMTTRTALLIYVSICGALLSCNSYDYRTDRQVAKCKNMLASDIRNYLDASIGSSVCLIGAVRIEEHGKYLYADKTEFGPYDGMVKLRFGETKERLKHMQEIQVNGKLNCIEEHPLGTNKCSVFELSDLGFFANGGQVP